VTPSTQKGRTLARIFVFGFVAALAAVPRFGDRENGDAPISDSDYYLDMTRVFAGSAEGFDPEDSAPGHPGSKHYARPLLALLAAPPVAAGVLSPRVSLSLISLLSAWVIAAGLYLILVARPPLLAIAWLPPLLFLTGFPQVNWGYHVLSDSLGYATAFAGVLAAWSFLRWTRDGAGRGNRRAGLALAGIWVLQAAAFLARETAWFTPVAVIAWVVAGREWKRDGPSALLLLATLLSAKIPHLLYVAHFGLETLRIPFTPGAWLDPVYATDFLVKSLLAFHVAWILAIEGLRSSGLRRVPPVLLGWSVAALLYVAAGYAHNSREGIGYPLRLTYALFPLVYVLAAHALQHRVPPRWRRVAAVALLAANAAVSALGVALDPGHGVILVPGTGPPTSAAPGHLEPEEAVGTVRSVDEVESFHPL
jgi:hypothetical protein